MQMKAYVVIDSANASKLSDLLFQSNLLLDYEARASKMFLAPKCLKCARQLFVDHGPNKKRN
jgi:hypothetical protein